jgi:hypothetical protein
LRGCYMAQDSSHGHAAVAPALAKVIVKGIVLDVLVRSIPLVDESASRVSIIMCMKTTNRLLLASRKMPGDSFSDGWFLCNTKDLHFGLEPDGEKRSPCDCNGAFCTKENGARSMKMVHWRLHKRRVTGGLNEMQTSAPSRVPSRRYGNRDLDFSSRNYHSRSLEKDSISSP